MHIFYIALHIHIWNLDTSYSVLMSVVRLIFLIALHSIRDVQEDPYLTSVKSSKI